MIERDASRLPLHNGYDALMRFLFFLMLLLLALPSHAHIDDEARQAYATMSISDDAVEIVVTIPARYAFPVLLDGASPIELDKLEPVDMTAAIGPTLAKYNPVRIDGVLVRPLIEGAVTNMLQSRLPPRSFIEPQVMQYGELRYVAVYELKSPPRRVSLTWDAFVPEYDDDGEPTADGEIAPVPLTVRFDDKQQLAILTSDEPGYVWHSGAAATIPAALYETQPVHSGPIEVPALSLGLVLAGLILAFVVYRKSHGVGVAVSLGSLLLALVVLPFGRLAYQPAASFPAVDDDEAIELFRSLHSNIYRAFDYTDEGAVYDALAQSVDGPMLESIYNDVYQSLIMREEGGAVSKVMKVDVTHAKRVSEAWADDEVRIAAPDEPGAFMVDVQWTVDGLVQHHGHTHSRTNAFDAVYVIAPRREGWRIVDAQVLDQRRIE